MLAELDDGDLAGKSSATKILVKALVVVCVHLSRYLEKSFDAIATQSSDAVGPEAFNQSNATSFLSVDTMASNRFHIGVFLADDRNECFSFDELLKLWVADKLDNELVEFAGAKIASVENVDGFLFIGVQVKRVAIVCGSVLEEFLHLSLTRKSGQIFSICG